MRKSKVIMVPNIIRECREKWFRMIASIRYLTFIQWRTFGYEYKECFVEMYNLWFTWSISPPFCIAASEIQTPVFLVTRRHTRYVILPHISKTGHLRCMTVHSLCHPSKSGFHLRTTRGRIWASDFLWHRATPFTAGQFADRKGKNNTKW
jgi:hypothetical protein